MLDVKQAYDIIRKEYPMGFARQCFDFGSFFMFIVGSLQEGNNPVCTGHVFDAVDKKTGKIFQYDILTDYDAYENAKEIKLRTIMDEIVERNED